MVVELTQEEITLIGWGLLCLHANSHPNDKQATKEQAISIMRILSPNTIYDFGD